MRSYRLRRAAVAALPALAVLVAGCGPGQESSAHDRSPVARPSSTAISLPPRPREVRLDGIDPCRILGPDQRAQLSLDNQPSGYVDAAFGNARACSMRGTASGNVARLALVTSEDVRVWLDENAQVAAKPLTVAAFPALEVRTPGVENACNVEVDTTAGSSSTCCSATAGTPRRWPRTRSAPVPAGWRR